MSNPKSTTSGTVISSSNLRDRGVMNFTPKRLDIPMSAAATHFIRHEVTDSTGFHMNAVLAEQTGITSARAKDVEDGLELRLLEKLKTIEEEAYRAGFEQGLTEGATKSFNENNAKTISRLSNLEELASRIAGLTNQLVVHNEAQLLDLMYYIAKTIAFRDIQENRDAIKEVLKVVTQSIQDDSNVTLRISPEDLAVVEEMKTTTETQFEYLSKMKIAPDATIQRGGCVIETNFGMIDATLETRFEKIWEMLQEKKPRISDVVE